MYWLEVSFVETYLQPSRCLASNIVDQVGQLVVKLLHAFNLEFDFELVKEYLRVILYFEQQATHTEGRVCQYGSFDIKDIGIPAYVADSRLSYVCLLEACWQVSELGLSEV